MTKNGKKYIKAAHYADLNVHIRKLSLLMDVSRSIMAEMDLDALLKLIMDRVTDVMSADRSSLFLIDRQRGEIWSRVAQRISEIRMSIGEGIVGYVAETGNTVNIPDAYQDPRFNHEFDERTGYHTKSILCMAIKNQRSEIIGSIQVLNKLDSTSFTRDDEDLLGAFCSLAGISLENARAYEELERERESLEIKVRERTKDLEEEKKKSDELLLNILPHEIAEELKIKGEASPRKYELVTVMFTDFKDFTRIAETMSPEDLVRQLDMCFYQFDEVSARYKLEKIKTIGDAYMCAGGLPEPNKTNPIDAILAALEMKNFMKKMQEIKSELHESFWQMKIGIHSGPAVAGVVGKAKFIYDIWGDTVNTASRMVSGSVDGEINISGTTFELIKDFFQCEYRGLIPVKHKGDIDMYLVERIRPELSVDEKGFVPNEIFKEKYDRITILD